MIFAKNNLTCEFIKENNGKTYCLINLPYPDSFNTETQSGVNSLLKNMKIEHRTQEYKNLYFEDMNKNLKDNFQEFRKSQS